MIYIQIIYIYMYGISPLFTIQYQNVATGVLLSAALEMPWLKVCQLDACPKLRASTLAEQLLQEMSHLALALASGNGMGNAMCLMSGVKTVNSHQNGEFQTST